jgi:hypothetical protein
MFYFFIFVIYFSLHKTNVPCYYGIGREYAMIRNLRAFFFLFIAGTVFYSGCVSQQKIIVGVSERLAANYTSYPSIEVDIAAVTDGDLAEIKDAGVENYFSPNGGLREKINAQRMFFSEEQTKPLMLASRAEIWKSWLQKDPSNIVVIASLPHNPDIPAAPAPDPRIIVIPIKKRFIFASNLFVLIDPKKIVQVKKAPVNPKTSF